MWLLLLLPLLTVKLPLLLLSRLFPSRTPQVSLEVLEIRHVLALELTEGGRGTVTAGATAT